MAFSWLVPRCVEFDEKDIEKIVRASIRIFRDIPWRIDGAEKFMEALRDF